MRNTVYCAVVHFKLKIPFVVGGKSHHLRLAHPNNIGSTIAIVGAALLSSVQFVDFEYFIPILGLRPKYKE